MTSRRTFLSVTSGVAGALVFAPLEAALAQAPGTNPFTGIPVTARARNGRTFNGTFDITRFATRNGQLVAVGNLQLVGRNLGRNGQNVAVPVTRITVEDDPATPDEILPEQIMPPAGCEILNLVLGPLQLNLLGLVVTIPNPVIVNITAVPGAGLLGDLLCAISNLLNGLLGGLTPALQSAIASLLNAITSILNGVTIAEGLTMSVVGWIESSIHPTLSEDRVPP